MTGRTPIKLVFGEKTFDIRPLSLDQVEALEELVATSSLFGGKEPDGQAPMRGLAGARQIIEIALRRDHADVDVLNLDGDVQSFVAAQTAILRHAGFMPDKPGEDGAAAGNAPTGGTSGAV